MPLIQTIHSQEATIGIWQMAETEDQLLHALHDRVLYEAGLAAFVSAKRRIEFLTVRLLLQQLTGRACHIGYEPSGRPYLYDSTCRISITHTRGYAAVIIHPDRPVAIDIEFRAEKVMRLRDKFLNEAELSVAGQPDALSYALLCWSAKESLFKISPLEEIDFRTHLLLEPFHVEESGQISGVEAKGKEKCCFTINYRSVSDYVLTWIVG